MAYISSYPGSVRVPSSPIGYPGNVVKPNSGGSKPTSSGTSSNNNNEVTYNRQPAFIYFDGKSYATFKGSDGGYYIAEYSRNKNNYTIKADTITNVDSLPKLYIGDKEYSTDSIKNLIDSGRPVDVGLSKYQPKKATTNTTTNKQTKPTVIDITQDPAYKKLLADQAAANERIEAQNKNIEDLIATIEDLRRPRSAQEMAKHYGVTLDEAQFLKERNEATNKYYDEATGYQNKLRNQYVRNTAGQYDNMYNRYLDTYQNAAPTASGKGIRAANLLSSALQGQQYMQNVDQGMLESVNDLEAARKKEIANNPNVAAQEYADLAAYLTQAGMNANAADVKGYAAAIKAASDMTLSSRQYAAQLAQNQATRYQGLANAAGTRASSAANSNNLWNQLYSWYQGIYGNKKDASNALLNYANVSNNITK